MDNIMVSVICCTYNQKKYIRQCLDSLVTQKTSFGYEVIIHDDCSSDGTDKIIKEYETRFPDIIRAYYEDANQYSQGKRFLKQIYGLAKGKYVTFCEGDDYWCCLDKLQVQFDIMERNPDCSICTHIVEKISETGLRTGKYFELKGFSEIKIFGKDVLKRYVNGELHFLIQTTSFMVKRQVLTSIPDSIYNSFRVGDAPLLMWSLHNGNYYYIDKVMSCYRVSAQGSTNVEMKNRNYALDRVISNGKGFLVFDEETNHRYWDSMKHRVSYYIVQGYYGDHSSFSKELVSSSKKELNTLERVISRIKFTAVGNVLRNMHKAIVRITK